MKDKWYTSSDWRTQDPGFYTWVNKPDPPVAASDQQPHGSRPEKQFGIFGPIPPPVASSPKAAGDKSAGYSQKPLCREHANKTYDELVDQFEKFDPVPAARKYNFNMCKKTDPIGKQFTTRICEMRRLVFEVLPDHAHRHLKWWKNQCALKDRTFKTYCTDPSYVLSLWATSSRSVNKHQRFWAEIQALIEDFDPENFTKA